MRFVGFSDLIDLYSFISFRQKNFTNIRLLHLPTADHFLFLNIARLKDRLNVYATAQREAWPSFVLLEPMPRLVGIFTNVTP